ncbi:ABC transporter permease [Nocardioides phosphati]|uniref:ABC transporter permease n=1 Tax=Nocardioides phosphati TaxID=1867775 RepID=A0ABQ2NDK6_9ACTN|nr:ABC transporter permease [Nocardioides phosphati]GGO93932.1 ABC transporter permease [Nocardioides phosphati]
MSQTTTGREDRVPDVAGGSLVEGFRSGRRDRQRLEFLGQGGAMLALLGRIGAAFLRAVRTGHFPAEELITETWYTIRVCTLPALAVSIPFGVVLALQVGVLAQQVGATSFTGAGNTLAVIRQAAPMITALMLSGVAGSAICADLGARKIREELDALEVMGISTIERVVMPRAICIVFVSCLLTGVVMFFAIITTLLISVVLLDLSPGTYLASVDSLASPADLGLSLVKAAVFGVICVTVAAHFGLTVKAGPAGVGDAVTTSVVVNFVLLFTANFVISQIATTFMGGPLG